MSQESHASNRAVGAPVLAGRNLLLAAIATGLLTLTRRAIGTDSEDRVDRLIHAASSAEDEQDVAGAVAAWSALVEEAADPWAARRAADLLRCTHGFAASEALVVWAMDRIAARAPDGFCYETDAHVELLLRSGREREALALLDAAVARRSTNPDLLLDRTVISARLQGRAAAMAGLDALDTREERRGCVPELTGDFESDHDRHEAAESAWLAQCARDGVEVGVPPSIDALLAGMMVGEGAHRALGSGGAALLAKLGLARLAQGDVPRAERCLAAAAVAAHRLDETPAEVAVREARLALHRDDLATARRALTSIQERDASLGRRHLARRIERLAFDLNAAEVAAR